MKRIMITGAAGFLGSRIVQYVNKNGNYQVIPVTHNVLDIVDELAVEDYFKRHQIEFLIHCAAISDTGFAQNYPKLSYDINVLGTLHLARQCKKHGIKFIYMSSDQIYNGCDWLGKLKETDEVHPVNVYGMHKLEAEQKVQLLLPEAVGLRLTWLYDLPIRGLKTNSNIIWNIIRSSSCNQVVKFPIWENRGVTYVWELVENMEDILNLPGGIYNCGSNTHNNTYELAQNLIENCSLFCGKELSEILHSDEERYKEQPRNLNMDIEKIVKNNIHFSDSIQGIRKCLCDYGLFQNEK